MSCGALCPCQPSCTVDTQGSKRDPISSEKSWLDYAVRYLSRTAICKGKGQEAVWNSKCKPSWWDSVVGLPWKNPTANPKDTKEVLMKKYDGLKDHLFSEGRFPNELREEATLWEEGKYKELFLLTSLSSLKDKVTGLHVAVREVSSKADEMGADVNQALIKDIQSCLGATLREVQNLSTSSTSTTRKNLKRPNSGAGKENVSVKKCRLMNPVKNVRQQSVSSSSPNVIPILPKQNSLEAISGKVDKCKPDQSRDIVLQLQKVLKKRKELSVAMNMSNHCIIKGNDQTTNTPKSSRLSCFLPSAQIFSTNQTEQEQARQAAVQNSSLPLMFIPENPPSPRTFVVRGLGEENCFEDSTTSQSDTPPISHNVESNSVEWSETNLPHSDIGDIGCNEYNNHTDDELFMGISPKLDNSSSKGSITIDSSEIDFLLSPVNQESWREDVSNTSVINLIEQFDESKACNVDESMCSNEILCSDNAGVRAEGGRASSNCSSQSQGSHLSDNSFSDSGCPSGSSFVDSILSPEEQNQLLLDDDIDGFLSHFTDSSSGTASPMDALMADLDSFVNNI